MKPHATSPHVVFGSTPPWRETLVPPRPDGQHFLGTSISELLSEPSVKSNGWLSTVYARLLVASSGPVGVVAGCPAADRLDAAGWLRVAPDSDVAAARNACWPALPEVARLEVGVGSLAPKLVIVGERDPYERLPLFARCGAWLFRALRHLGHDELTVYVTNALDATNRPQPGALAALHEAFARYDPTWLALGAIAHEVLTGAGIEHVAAEHPAHARRFAFAAGPEGYAATLEAAGLGRGPGIVGVLEGATDLPARLGVPPTPNYRPNDSKLRQTVPAPILDQARMAFVMGEALTLKDAAARATEDANVRRAIVRLARQQGWEIERDRFLADKRERAKSSATAKEAERIGHARALAWEATELALSRIVDDLKKDEVKIFAKDAKALNEVAISLSEKGDHAFDDERKRLASLSPEAFAAELKKTLESFGVQDPAPG